MDPNLWADCPEIQARLIKIREDQLRLQEILGFVLPTWEQRLEQGQQRKIQRELEDQERLRRQREAEQYRAKAPGLRLPQRRPL